MGKLIEEDVIDGYDRIRFRIIARNKRPAVPGSRGHEISLVPLSYYSVFKIERQNGYLRIIKEKIPKNGLMLGL